MQGGAHSLSSCGDEGGLAGLKLMAIKTPLAPHPIHYEQHCRRRRSSLVLPVPAFPGPGLGSLGAAWATQSWQPWPGCPRHAGTAGAPAPPHRAHRPPFRAPSFQILPPTDASTASSQGKRAAGVAELPSRPCPFHIDWAVSTAPTVADLQRAAIRQFHMLLSENLSCPLSRLVRQACLHNMSIAAQDCTLKIVTLCLCVCAANAAHLAICGRRQMEQTESGTMGLLVE